MKKRCYLEKLLGRTLLVLCLQLFITASVLGSDLYGQQHKVLTVNLENVTLLKALEHLTNVMGCEILYNHEQVRSDRKFDLKMSDRTLDEILKKCLEGTKLTYKLVDNVFVIIVKGEDEKAKAKELTGVVVDVKGDSIPGVTVVIKGTTIGTSTNVKGLFKLAIPANLKDVVLVFSFIGMENQEIKVGTQTKFRVVMKEKKEKLDEVVVTGIANINKKSFTGSAVTVSREDILKVSKRSVLDAIQTFDPSFRIVEDNLWGSDPNRVPEMYVRGRTGIGVKELDETTIKNNPNLPTFILDGFEVTAEKVYDMDPERIASVTILKDAAATAMYGSRASNGVIVLTTVAPRAGEIRVNYTFNGAVTMPSLGDYNLMNAAEKLEAERRAGFYEKDEESYYERLALINEGVDTDWLAQPLRNAFNHKHSLYLEGGHEDFRFGLDATYDAENGVMKESYRNNLSLGLMLDYRIGKWLQVRNNMTYSTMKSEDSPYGEFSDYTILLPYNKIKDEYGNYLKNLKYGTSSGGDNYNPLYEATLNNYSKSHYEEIRNETGVIWYINDYLRADVSLSVSKQWNGSRSFIDPKSAKSQNSSNEFEQMRGSLKLSSGNIENIQFQARLQYNQSIKNHHINATLAYDLITNKVNSEGAEYRGFPSSELDSPEFAAEIFNKPNFADNHTRSIGVVGTVNYTYNNIYLFDASIRLDASSEFGANSRLAPFGSGGVGINIHNYKFMQENVGWLTELKVRASYGQTGHAGFQPYVASTIYENNMDHWYSSGYGASLLYLGNEDLKWEKTNKLNLGVEIELLSGLLYVSGEYFKSTTVDMITPVTIPSSAGFTEYQDNMGKNETTGYEFHMRSEIFRNDDWHVAVFANLSHEKSKIKEISEALKSYNDKVNDFYEDLSKGDEISKPLLRYEEGGSLTAIWGYNSLGIDPANGKELILNRDGTISYETDPVNQVIIGDEEPDAKGSFGLNLSYKGFSLFAAFDYEFGGDIYNQTLVNKVENVDIQHQNADKRVLTDRWYEAGDIAKFKSIADSGETTQPTSRFVQENNYLNLTSLSLSYDFNKHAWLKKAHLSSLRFEVSMNDVWRLSSVKQERGLYYPFANTVNFTLRVGF